MPGEQQPENLISHYVDRLAASFRTWTGLGNVAASAAKIAYTPEQSTGNFMEPIDPRTKEQLNVLPLDLASLVIQDGASSKRAFALLRRNSAFRATYAETTVPDAFQRAHPNILFMPPSTTKPPGRTNIALLEKYNLLDNSAFHETLVTPEALIDQLFHIKHTVLAGVDERLVLEALKELTFSYISNLELYRLVKDPDGTVRRETRTPGMDAPQSTATPKQAPYSDLLWDRGIHSNLRSLTADHWTTWWFRCDGLFWDFSPREIALATVGELEKTNKIALDLFMPRSSALVAFRGPTAEHT